MNTGLHYGSTPVNAQLNPSGTYNISLYSGNNNNNTLYIYDISSSLVYSSSWAGTASLGTTFSPSSSTFYTIQTSTSGPICCSPTLDYAVRIERSLYLYFTTGSCGSCNNILLESSNGGAWISEGTSSYSPATASYHTGSMYYRLTAYCSGGYVSDPSNILIYPTV
jgi:hypothetical protein